EQPASPWKSTVGESLPSSEFDYPTVDSFGLPDEVFEPSADHLASVGEEQVAIPSPTAAADDSGFAYEVPMPGSPFEEQVKAPEANSEPEVVDARVRIIIVDDSQTARKLIA